MPTNDFNVLDTPPGVSQAAIDAAIAAAIAALDPWYETTLPDDTLAPMGTLGLNGFKFSSGVITVFNPFVAPAAPTASLSATAGIVTTSDHGVRIRYNSAGGSMLSAATTVTADGAHKINVTVPAKPTGIVTMDVVMTKADGTAIYEVALNQSAGVYAINTADAGLTVLVSTANTAGGNLSVAGELRFGDIATSAQGITAGPTLSTLQFRDYPVGDANGINWDAMSAGGSWDLNLKTRDGGTIQAKLRLHDGYVALEHSVSGNYINLDSSGASIPAGKFLVPGAPTTTDPDVAGQIFTCTAAELAGLLGAGAKHILMSKHA